MMPSPVSQPVTDRRDPIGALLEDALDPISIDAHRKDQYGTNQLMFIASHAVMSQDRVYQCHQLDGPTRPGSGSFGLLLMHARTTNREAF